MSLSEDIIKELRYCIRLTLDKWSDYLVESTANKLEDKLSKVKIQGV